MEFLFDGSMSLCKSSIMNIDNEQYNGCDCCSSDFIRTSRDCYGLEVCVSYVCFEKTWI